MIEQSTGNRKIPMGGIPDPAEWKRSFLTENFFKYLLVDFIIAKKIVENAKRAILYLTINIFDDLYDVLNQNLNTGTSVELFRTKLENCPQNNDTV